jgi:N-acetylglucosaminyldiphosphoundecaprenol N-acetyl-beta-D-mannosaminyltransferase
MNHIRILRRRIDNVTFNEVLALIQKFVRSSACNQIVTANTLMLLAAEKDLELANIIEKASLVVPESWGVSWASRRQKQPLNGFIPGIDLFAALCCWAAKSGHPIYLLGAKPGTAYRAGENLKRLYPGLRLAGTHHGYFSKENEQAILTDINMTHPSILFVGMDVPRQEKWIACNLQYFGAQVVMGVGGSFDVLAGDLHRAPKWIRRMGIEWAFRTLQEPWRIQRIKDLPVFMWKVMQDRQRQQKLN